MIDGTAHRGRPQPFLTDERLGKAGWGGVGIREHSCRQRETSHYQEKGKFISRERFRSTRSWQKPRASSIRCHWPKVSQNLGLVLRMYRSVSTQCSKVHSCRGASIGFSKWISGGSKWLDWLKKTWESLKKIVLFWWGKTNSRFASCKLQIKKNEQTKKPVVYDDNKIHLLYTTRQSFDYCHQSEVKWTQHILDCLQYSHYLVVTGWYLTMKAKQFWKGNAELRCPGLNWNYMSIWTCWTCLSSMEMASLCTIPPLRPRQFQFFFIRAHQFKHHDSNQTCFYTLHSHVIT